MLHPSYPLLLCLPLQVVSMLLSVGQEGRDPAYCSPLMYSWHGKQYLGAAHGLAGIMTVLMQVSPLIKE